MNRYYVVNGAPTTGKDTFCSFCQDILTNKKLGRGFVISSVDFVKEVARFCGWKGDKTPKNRKFLSDLKDLLSDWDNIPNKKIFETIKSLTEQYPYENLFFFIMIREPENIKQIVNGYGAKAVLIKRDINIKEFSNHADAEVENYNYDLIIQNNGTLDDLYNSANKFILDEYLKF